MAKYLNLDGLQTLWTKAKNTFALVSHTHKDNIDEISATATGAVTDNMDIVTSNANRTADVKVYRRSVTLLWNYIVSKCKSTFSATDTNPITGKGVYEFNKMNWASFSTNVRNSGLYGNTSILCSKLLSRYVYDIYCNNDITLTIINDTTATKNLTVNGDQNAYVSLETNAGTNISLTNGSWIHFVMIDNSLFLSVRKQAKSIYLSQFLQGKSALCIHPESVQVLIPYAFNDQYRNIDNGGTSILYETDSTDFTQVELNKTKTISENTKAFFDGSSGAASWTSTSGDSVTVVDVKGYSDMAWTTRLYIDFGSAWGFANVKCYVMKSSSAYVEAERDQYGNGFWTFRTGYNGASYQNRFRFVMWNTSATANTSHRIAQIGTVRYNSPLFLTTLASKYHTHTGDQITSAVNYSKMQEAELLDNTKDIVTEIKKINTRCVKWYRWNETSRPVNAPTNSARSLMQAIVQYEGGVRITLIAYPQDTSEYYYIAHYAGISATTISWRIVYTVPTSTYDATGTRAVNGTAVASAISAKANAASVTGATKCKVTYNSQGVITAGADLAASDIPNLAASKITSGTFADERIASASNWNGKLDKNGDQTYNGMFSVKSQSASSNSQIRVIDPVGGTSRLNFQFNTSNKRGVYDSQLADYVFYVDGASGKPVFNGNASTATSATTALNYSANGGIDNAIKDAIKTSKDYSDINLKLSAKFDWSDSQMNFPVTYNSKVSGVEKYFYGSSGTAVQGLNRAGFKYLLLVTVFFSGKIKNSGALTLEMYEGASTSNLQLVGSTILFLYKDSAGNCTDQQITAFLRYNGSYSGTSNNRYVRFCINSNGSRDTSVTTGFTLAINAQIYA